MKKSGTLHRRLNDLLTIVVLALCLYLVTMPLLPNVQYYAGEVLAQSKPLATPSNVADISAEPRLKISRIKFDKEILEGADVGVLNKGIWRRPNTSKPDVGGNTVIVGHRYFKNTPGIFYHLDKVKKGDEIVIDWDKARYFYEVTNILVVPPNAAHIEGESKEPLLTLYTCTPLWTSKERLVIQAKLVRTYP